METFAYPHFSSTVHVALFVHVTNAAELRARIIRASTLEGVEGEAEREAVNFAFVDALLVRHRFYVPLSGHAIESCRNAGDECLTHSNGHNTGPPGCSAKQSED